MKRRPQLSPETLFQMLEARRLDLGLSQPELMERAFGVRSNATIQNLKRGSMISADKLQMLVEALGWEMYIGPSTEQPDFAFIDPETGETHFAEAKSQFGASATRIKWASGDDAFLWFDRDWLATAGLSAEHTIAARSPDDKMTPTIGALSTMLIDTRPTFDRCPVAAIEIDEQITIGRPHHVTDAIYTLHYDKIGTAPITLGPGIQEYRHIGRVVWTARSV